MVEPHSAPTYDKSPKASFVVKVEDYAPLVKRIAHHMMARMPPSVQVDDLIQAGMIGLLEASKKYDAGKGASFETYAGIRIRGAIVDEMRRGDWVPRSVHRNSRKISDAIAMVESRTGRDAQDQDVADEMELSLDEYHAMLQDSAASRLCSFEETYPDDSNGYEETELSEPLASPFDSVQNQSMKSALMQAITQLPERERLVLALYYDEELNLKEIGQIIGVSESRVSQIHSQAALRLRTRLAGWRIQN